MSKGRILVVDDLPDWRETLSGVLRDEGYEVRVAEGRPEALRLLESERFHLAVLDVRLDESDEDNREGLELMRQIKAYDPTVSVIILTGYADVEIVQEALRPQEDGLSLAYSFVEKPNSQELIKFVRSAFEREIRVDWGLVIHAAADFVQKLAARIRFTNKSMKPPDSQLGEEIDELLRKLFHNCEEITIHPLEQGFSGAAVFRVEPCYPERGRGESVVAKIGEWPLIEQEAVNFAQEVRGVVGGHRLPQHLELFRTRSLGGLVYSFAGLGDTTSFIEFYMAANPFEVVPVLENLFFETCFPWGRHNKTVRSSFNFAEHYCSHLNLSPTELRSALSARLYQCDYLSPLSDSGSMLQFLGRTALVNPVEFVFGQPLIGDAHLTLVHGDLTGYNVILDHHFETWLIDFAKTGQGLLLQDFASFENFVKFSLLESREPRLFYEWEKELVNSSTLNPLADLLRLQVPDQCSKAHQAVLTIRQLAYQVSGDEHLREYLIGLLFHALKLITIKSLKPGQRDLALVSAALICQRLVANPPNWQG
jgi:CheY-like chemotaxis protein